MNIKEIGYKFELEVTKSELDNMKTALTVLGEHLNSSEHKTSVVSKCILNDEKMEELADQNPFRYFSEGNTLLHGMLGSMMRTSK